MHAYQATILRDLGSSWVVVGGVADHVHLLFGMGKKHPPVTFVEQVKRESSKFVKTLGDRYQAFYWQRGYGMFSVSPTMRDEAELYVREQEKHHRRQSFQDEFRGLLNRYGIAFNEQQIWD